MEKFLDELILSERKKRKEKVLDEQIDLERDLPEQYLQTVIMSDKATSIKKIEMLILRFHCLMYQWSRGSLEKFVRAVRGRGEEFYRK